MAMYYPQDVTLDMGPTAVLPRSAYLTCDHEAGLARTMKIGEDRLDYNTIRQLQKDRKDTAAVDMLNAAAANSLLAPQEAEDGGKGKFATVPAGSVVLIHYDLAHRGTRRRVKGASERFMVKFQAFRVSDPSDHEDLPTAQIDGGDTGVVAGHMAAWLASQPAPLPAGGWKGIDLPALESQVLSGSLEAPRIEAAYTLGGFLAHADASDDGQAAARRSSALPSRT